VYSPENLRLGEALACYARPGHIVIGADDHAAAEAVAGLFAPMEATCLRMSLASAEMTKHAINSFLAASITLSNQWADLCAAVGADFAEVAAAMKHDPRIGKRAYLSPGVGFSGGTLGRDLRVLDALNRAQAGGKCPIFGDIWNYNRARLEVVRDRCQQVLGGVQDRTIALLGMTYKPGTSTLRRSLPLQIAEDLATHGAAVRAFDPRADWNEVAPPRRVAVCASAYEAARGAEMLVLLTEWPDFRDLDYGRIKTAMTRPILFDTKNMLQSQRSDLERLGFRVLTIGRPERR
jgi:UDPglucose 6-dehydrogenase